MRTFIFNRDGIEESVEGERWGWGVIYKDDTELHQFGDDGTFHQFREIRQEEVKLFVMYKLEDMTKRFDIPVSKGMKLIHFYRNTKPWYLDDFVRVYVFGYEKNIHGRNEKTLVHIFPDDRVIISDIDEVDYINFNIK